MKNLLCIVFLFLLVPHLQAQRTPVPPKVSQNLLKLADELQHDFLQRRSHAMQKAADLGLPVRQHLDDGRIMELQYFDEHNLPVYFQTRNKGAATSTGAADLHPGGALKLFQDGAGVTAGVWDGGSVEATHDELKGRIMVKDGSVVNNHATHVAGTISAQGINPAAKGMAPASRVLSYDWNNDHSEMAAEAAQGLLISNHSYGMVLGWNWNSNTSEWQWMAHADSTRDFRFGYYSSLSRSLDQLAFEAPHYLVVWAAGNDRNNSGDGSRPPDGPYDSIGPEGVAKNILTVGAAQKLAQDYSGPHHVSMSPFSSWGPTDDGRIKPDLVGAGVQLTSTISGNSYATYSGTSMASPNVTGTLMLLQQLYYQNHERYMKAATLKGLAIHTSREAGDYPGPDFQYGWGLLDAEKAARMILFQDDSGIIIREDSLLQDQVVEIEFQADGSGEIVATLSWTDPAGTPVGQAMNPKDLMLVNDLDVRIIRKQDGEVFYPWTLNGQSPGSPASRGDNIRDNVERINIPIPEAGTYTLQVLHKDSLRNGSQDFSLLLQGAAIPRRQSFFWVGNSGNWNDHTNWSLTSGGDPADVLPGITDHLVFDHNSFPDVVEGEEAVISLQENVAGYSFQFQSEKAVRVEPNGYTMEITGSFYADGQAILDLQDLNLRLSGNEGHYVLSFPGQQQAAFSLVIAGQGTWTLQNDIALRSLLLENGTLIARDRIMQVQQLQTDSGFAGMFDLSGAQINGLQQLQFLCGPQHVDATGSVMNFGEAAESDQHLLLHAHDHVLHQVSSLEAGLQVMGNHVFSSLTAAKGLLLEGNNQTGSLQVKPGTRIELAEGSLQQVGQSLVLESSQQQPVELIGAGNQPAAIEMMNYQKLCFDHLIIYQVAIVGEAAVAAGLNSAMDELSTGWLPVACNDLLFPDFSVSYACADGLTFFTDKSSGAIEAWDWQITKSNGVEASEEQHPQVGFPEAGAFPVSLTISNALDNRELNREITVSENTLESGGIYLSGERYTSARTALYYQWYLDGAPIPEANFRSFENIQGLSGTFQVMLSDNVCNILSEPVVVVSTNGPLQEDKQLHVYPNPAVNQVHVNAGQQAAHLPWLHITINDLAGRVHFSQVYPNAMETIRISDLSLAPGVYVISVHYGTFTRSEKLIIGPK